MTKIIRLEDYSDIYKEKREDYKFIKAYATNTRYMGVVGLRMHFEKDDEKLFLFFHLGYEEYGFDRFEVIDSEDNLDEMTQSFVGGLGGKLKNISLEEASYLIYKSIEVGENYYGEIPLEFFTYEYLISDFEIESKEKLYNKICTEIKSDEECINYYIMRTIGMDLEIRDIMLSNDKLEYNLVDEPSIMLRNEIIEREGYIITNSIVDYLDNYKMIISKFIVKNKKIISAEKLDEIVMTSKEATFSLNKTEYISIFYVEDIKGFRSQFEHNKPGMQRNIYNTGLLYTEYNNNNSHVDNRVYYLNDDVHAMYYLTTEHHFIISCFDEKKLEVLEKEISKKYNQVDNIEKLIADTPIIYNFITSGNTDFFEFLGE